jgi:hypothetical protein
MLGVFLLAPSVAPTWWNFTNDEFEDLKASSLHKPIFVVCYSQWCPHCSGLPEGTVQYSQGAGNRSDVYITMLDCSVRHECGHFHVEGTPHMVLVMGRDRRYWPRIWQRDGKEWNIFIDKYVKPSLREVRSDAELLAAKREPADGGAAFHVETPTADHDVLRQLAELSREFRIYNDTFTYRLNADVAQPVLTAHTSPHCSATWRSGSVREFVERHKFGSRHRYDMDEFKALRRRTKTAMVVVDEGLSNGQKYALERVPRAFCDDIAFGYVAVKDTKWFLKVIKKDRLTIPILVFGNPDKCHAYHMGRTADAAASGFLARAARGDLCGKVYLNGTAWDDEAEELADEDATPTPKPKPKPKRRAPNAARGVSGAQLLWVWVIFCFLGIGIARLRTPAEGKQE